MPDGNVDSCVVMRETTTDTPPGPRPAGRRPRRRAAVLPLRDIAPSLGLAGSRSAHLHEGPDCPDTLARLSRADVARVRLATVLGTFGSALVAVGGLGAGAMPVVDNPLWTVGWINVLARMLQATTVTVFVGIGALVAAWLILGLHAVPVRPPRTARLVPLRTLRRILALWLIPLTLTAPLFTQDIYSYLAQGAIAHRGLDAYSAGPVDLLGINDPLARSVPYLWAHSPSPYGPVALLTGSLISAVTGDTVVVAVVLHRLVAVAGVALAGWAIVRLAARCGVRPQAAFWLGVLNPLTLLHLVGGIHNEALMMGLLLAGVEFCLRAVDRADRPRTSRVVLMVAGTALVCCAGMVKVTAFMALGFTTAALARRRGGRLRDLVVAALWSGLGLVVVTGGVSLLSGIGLGWIHAQGGAASIVSWMSVTTDIGLLTATSGMLLGLGDHTEAALTLARGAGVVGLFWVARMLWASFRGRIHPVGGLGVATFFLVAFFPVVHPWYLLWAILPLAAWANHRGFRLAVILYSVAFSFFILPRGLSLPPGTVLTIYVMSAVGVAVVLGAVWWVARRRGLRLTFRPPRGPGAAQGR